MLSEDGSESKDLAPEPSSIEHFISSLPITESLKTGLKEIVSEYKKRGYQEQNIAEVSGEVEGDLRDISLVKKDADPRNQRIGFKMLDYYRNHEKARGCIITIRHPENDKKNYSFYLDNKGNIVAVVDCLDYAGISKWTGVQEINPTFRSNKDVIQIDIGSPLATFVDPVVIARPPRTPQQAIDLILDAF